MSAEDDIEAIDDETPRCCPVCGLTFEARSDQGVSIDVHEECIACWGPRLDKSDEGAARFRMIVAEAVRRGWMKPAADGEGATLDGTSGMVRETDVGTLVLEKLDAILDGLRVVIEAQGQDRVVLRHIMARLYSKSPPKVPPEVWAWLGIELAPEPDEKPDILIVGGFSH